jgi:hypothetical protein
MRPSKKKRSTIMITFMQQSPKVKVRARKKIPSWFAEVEIENFS